MRLDQLALGFLAKAFEKHRQLTLGEEMMARQMIVQMRGVAQRLTRGPIAIAADDDDMTVLMKRKGIFEIAKAFDENAPEFAELRLDPDFLHQLLDEAAHDYRYRPDTAHPPGTPPQVIAAQNARRIALEGGETAVALHDVHERVTESNKKATEATDKVHERVDALEAKLNEQSGTLGQIQGLLQQLVAAKADDTKKEEG